MSASQLRVASNRWNGIAVGEGGRVDANNLFTCNNRLGDKAFDGEVPDFLLTDLEMKKIKRLSCGCCDLKKCKKVEFLT